MTPHIFEVGRAGTRLRMIHGTNSPRLPRESVRAGSCDIGPMVIARRPKLSSRICESPDDGAGESADRPGGSTFSPGARTKMQKPISGGFSSRRPWEVGPSRRGSVSPPRLTANSMAILFRQRKFNPAVDVAKGLVDQDRDYWSVWEPTKLDSSWRIPRPHRADVHLDYAPSDAVPVYELWN